MNDVSEPSSNDLSSCLELVRQGDENAARDLVRRLHPLVMKIIRSHLPPREGEEDLEQKIFIKMFQKIDQYKAQVPFEHWVSRIAVNTCLNQIKSEKSRHELRWSDLSPEQTEIMETLTTGDDQLDASLHVASKDLVEKLLECLDPADRLLIHLLYLEGHTSLEVRQITGWNHALIRIRAFRARARMKKHYARLHQEKYE